MVVRCNYFETWTFEEDNVIHHDESAYMLDTWPLKAYTCFSNTNYFLKVAKRPLKG
jgi:hypothetical protein